MDELPLFNSVFPFDCGYHSCDKVYHLEDFIHVALLWGFINLISEEYQLVGFTCPACRRTSIRKLKLDVEDRTLEYKTLWCVRGTLLARHLHSAISRNMGIMPKIFTIIKLGDK